MAQDFQVETLKDHFPHYFFLENIEDTLNYVGLLPAYEYFEPKRTSQVDYQKMLTDFKDNWGFLEVSRNYILSDCKSLYQIIVKFFESFQEAFPINPLKPLTIPGLAFTTWRTVQLPKLQIDNLQVYDLSHSIGNQFRDAYCGEIVDVYRPHLIGEGFYYDVNSLYPTAMCNSMPVGIPTLVSLTPDKFQEDLFGFLRATVRAPDNEYIGLLPIKHSGRFICPGGSFTGFFFSEELKFAPSNGSSSAPPNSSSTPAAPTAPSSSSPSTSSFSQMLSKVTKESTPVKSGSLKVYNTKGELIEANPNNLDSINSPSPRRDLHTSSVLIKPMNQYETKIPLENIVTADLESLILNNGTNLPYMAEWYGENKEGKKIGNVFDITAYDNSSHEMLKNFWLDLLKGARGCTVYFHNWSGYDAYLSLEALVSLYEYGYTFNPILNNGRIICLTVHQNKKIVLTIKDSFKILPGALGQPAKEFQVPTQKDHFPHYFNPLEMYGELNWSGPLPSYEYFEPKRTSLEDYKELESLYPDNWNFIEVSRKYIHGDVVSLHQILVNFFTELNLKFRVNPLNNLSAPGIAYTTWKTEQLPLLHQDNLEVYDLSRTSDDLFREVYLEGIVDVYRPHLIGQGFYYDETWSEEYKATFSTVLRSTKFWFLFLNRKIRSNL